MRFNIAAPLLVLVCACGGDDSSGGPDGGGGGSADAAAAPAMITISGEATKREGINETPAEGAMVAAYKNSDPNTPVAMATADAAGMYSLTVATGGVAVDGYIKATLAGFLDLYLYPPKPLTADFAGASLNIVNQDTVNLMYTICQHSQDTTKTQIAVIVADAAENPIAGATVTASPAATKSCFNGTNGLPSGAAMMTEADGIAYLLNVNPGEVTVSAGKGGSTFGAHKVNARAGTFTTTVIQQ